MISTFKQNSVRVIVLTAVSFLIIAMFLITMGFTNGKKAMPSEQNLESIQILTGIIDVEGAGVSITLTDNESNKHDIYNVIHDEDIIRITNLLTSAGAEVISINDERLMPISKIKANKMMIKVNNNEYGSPYIIKAIGDPEVLSHALEMEGSYVDLLKEHVDVKIGKEDKLFIPRYKENIYFQYAKPVEK